MPNVNDALTIFSFSNDLVIFKLFVCRNIGYIGLLLRGVWQIMLNVNDALTID